MEDFQRLISIICNGLTTNEQRNICEKELLSILTKEISPSDHQPSQECLQNNNNLKQYITLLYEPHDTLCFFLCILFQKILWKYWNKIKIEDKKLMNDIIIELLTTKVNIPLYLRSKLEQLIAVICIQSGSLQSILYLLQPMEQTNGFVGLSLLKTTIENIYSEDSKISNQLQYYLHHHITEIVVPLTNLICTNLSSILYALPDNHNATTTTNTNMNNPITITTQHLSIMLLSLEILKLIIMKVVIGNHITIEVIDLLFRLIEYGIHERRLNRTSTNYSISIILLSLETLIEFMSKKYLPTSTSNNNILILKHMLLKTNQILQLLYQICSMNKEALFQQSQVDDSSEIFLIVKNVLEYITSFSDSHLESCIHTTIMQSSTVSSNNLNNNYNNSSSNNYNSVVVVKVDEEMNGYIIQFFEQLVEITILTNHPEILSRLVAVWNKLILLGSVRDKLILQSDLCVRLSAHLLQACLISMNRKHLFDDIEELFEDIQLTIFADVYIKLILSSNIDILSTSSNTSNTNNKEMIQNTEEVTNIGSLLRRDTTTFFMELVSCDKVSQWLYNTITDIVVRDSKQLLQFASSTSTYHSHRNEVFALLLDELFLVKLLPFIILHIPGQCYMPLIAQLLEINRTLIIYQSYGESNIHNSTGGSVCQHKEASVLFVNITQILGQLIQSGVLWSTDQNENYKYFEQIFNYLLEYLSNVINLKHELLINSVAILCYQSVSYYYQQQLSEVHDHNTLQVLARVQYYIEQNEHKKDLPSECISLLICMQDMLDKQQPSTIASLCIQKNMELIDIFENYVLTSNGVLAIDSCIEALLYYMLNFNGLNRNHARSKPNRRQCYITIFSSSYLEKCYLERFLTSVMTMLLSTLSNHNHQSLITMNKSLQLMRLVISLTSGSLQALGKKTFGKMSFEIFKICIQFIENICSNNTTIIANKQLTTSINNQKLDQIFFSNYQFLEFTKQCLELAQIIAESTASISSTANVQIHETYRCLQFISTGLYMNENICAELLQPILKAGIICSKCYWQSTQKGITTGGILSSLSTSSSSLTNNNNNNNNNNTASNSNTTYQSGENVSLMVILVTQLCMSSLGPNVPPQDTLTALEGLVQLGSSEKHNLFSIPWFQSSSWELLLTTILKAILLQVHLIHRSLIDEILVLLINSGILAYTGITITKRIHILDSHIYQKYNEFWKIINQEVIQIAAEYQCDEIAQQLIIDVFRLIESQDYSSLNNDYLKSRNKDIIDLELYMCAVLNPISCEIMKNI